MQVDQELPIVVARSKAFHVFVGESGPFDHRFGGAGLSFGGSDGGQPLRLQPLFNFDCADDRLGYSGPASRLALYYGFEHSACEIEYCLEAGDQLRLVTMNPEVPEADLPYPNYPLDFPISPVRLEPVEFGDIKEIVTAYAFFAFLHFNSGTFDPDRFTYVVVPPRKEYGVSLWGEDGDAALVTVGFSIDPEAGMIKVVQAMS
jgi:hypothetical protein